MITTIYKCDRCGHEQADEKSMWHVETLSYYCGGGSQSYPSHRNVALWCRKCADEFQLVTTPRPTPDVPVPPVVSLEDQIREIVRTEIEAHL